MADLMRTSNPALNAQRVSRGRRWLWRCDDAEGNRQQDRVLLLCVIATAAWTWNIFMHSQNPQAVMPLAIAGGLADLFSRW